MNCLQCGASLDQDFGIVACTECGAVMMIDMDGKPQLAESGTRVTSEEAISQASIESPSSDNNFSNDFPVEAIPESSDLSFQAGVPVLEIAPEPPVHEFEALELAEEPVAEPVPIDSEPSNEWFDQGLDQSLAPVNEEPMSVEPDPRLSSGDFSDVAEFGNQDGSEGALQFELILSGLDHADLQREVLHVLSDPRLFLNVRELHEQMSQGILMIPGLSAARTSLLVSRLRHLKIGIQWRQKLYEV